MEPVKQDEAELKKMWLDKFLKKTNARINRKAVNKHLPQRTIIELPDDIIYRWGLKDTLRSRIEAGESTLHYHGRRSGTRVRKILRQHPHMIADDRFFDVIITETMIHRAQTPGT